MNVRRKKLRFLVALLTVTTILSTANAQQAFLSGPTLEEQLLSEDAAGLANAARSHGDPARGAIIFYQPHLTCTKCHTFGEDASPLGPDLTKTPEKKLTDSELVDSILLPSKSIREGYEPVVIITDAGLPVTGLLAEENDERVILRDPAEAEKLITILKDEIDERAESTESVMPPALVNQLANRQQFLDLVRYVIEITDGGPQRAFQLEPDPSLYQPPPLPEYEERIDHAGMIADLDDTSFLRGEAIYQRLCVNCHGTKDEPGSLPTSLRFASDTFRNGSDPASMYKTLTHGFGLMVPQTWMVPQQKYDVTHYIRETYLKPHNPSQYTKIDEAYLAGLPKGDTRGPEPSQFEPWVAMDYGPNLTATYEIGEDGTNFAYKGIATRLDDGPGGVTRGKYWMMFDEDTLRIAAGWSGDHFIDYKAIMLNGQHAIHPRIVGRLHFENKTGPGWANPETGRFEDPRIRGRDDRHYGPLPRHWAHYKGLYHHGNQVIVSYTVGDTNVLEMPSIDTTSTAPVFARNMDIGPRRRDMILQVAHRAAGWKLREKDEPHDRLAVFTPAEELTAEEAPRDGTPLAFDGHTRVEVMNAADIQMARADYTIRARIKTEKDGTIFAKTAPTDTWVPDGKTLFIRGGRLAFDIGWVGAVTSTRSVADGRWHDVAVTFDQQSGKVTLFIDGKQDAQKRLQARGLVQAHVVRLGYTAANFPKPSPFQGHISHVWFWQRKLANNEIAPLSLDDIPTDGLLAAWQLHGAEGELVRDATGNEHEGQILHGRPTSTPATAEMVPLVASLSQAIPGAEWLVSEKGDLRLRIPAGQQPLKFTLSLANVETNDDIDPLVEQLLAADSALDLTPLTQGGPPRWPGTLALEGTVGPDDGPFAVDVLTHPETNPWFCRVRPTGFDFLPDGRRAAVCCWDGDVWMVSGIDRPQDGLTWQRIASGMFQPLGLKYLNDKIYVACRDQIAILHDFNGDGETDFYENFNNDHQVTDHFHEFAMGLQTDADGNFYYAKSARHAKPALVPHHGTLLKVTADGSRTEILAKGFRAANGVCINPDGTFIVTDQEGHWCPKNRINWITPDPNKFYGNMYGYHDVTDPDDALMEQPLCWITNAFDRSPAELLWVDSDKWSPLNGALLNTSYGYGMVYVVPYEQVDGVMQGGMARLLDKPFPTGVMRGRFHPGNGQLYLCGMFAWAGSATQPGGFYRLRYTGKPLHMPVGLHATRDGMHITFTDPLDRTAAENPANYAVMIWSLKRTANYGSDHINEHPLQVTAATLSPDGKTVSLRIPNIQPTWCMEIRYRLKSPDGNPVERVIHNTVHRLGN